MWWFCEEIIIAYKKYKRMQCKKVYFFLSAFTTVYLSSVCALIWHAHAIIMAGDDDNNNCT